MLPNLLETATRFTYNAAAGRYRSKSTGRFVSGAQVRQGIDQFVDGQSSLMVDLGRQLQAGEISLSEWQTSMMQQIKDIHLASVAAQRGGWAQMTPADYGRAGRYIRDQYGYLRDFADQIADGTQRLDGTLLRRIRLYGQAGRHTYHLAERADMIRRGFTHERSVLDPAAQHCEGERSCTEQAAKGWQKIGDMLPIGERICNMNDRCHVEYRNEDTEEVRR